MPAFNNLPGTITVKEDGNLTVLEGVPGNVTVVLGTSPDGPIGSLYLVRQTSDAEVTFDPDGTRSGTLIRGMYEAFDTGAKYVALYRIGSSPAILKLNGWVIHTNDSNVNSAKNFKIFYSFTNGKHILKVYSATTNEVVYDNILGIDTGALEVYFDQALVTTGTITVGADAAGVFLNAVDAKITSLTGASYAIGDKAVTLTTEDGIQAGSTLEITGSSDATDDGKYIISYVYNKKANIAYKIVNGVKVVFAGFKGASVTTGTATEFDVKSTFTNTNLGLSLSYNEKYEALERAFWELESAQVDVITPMDVQLDTPNLVDNIGNIVVPAASDYLGKAYKFEYNGEIFFFWQTGTTVQADIIPTPEALGIDGIQADKLVKGKYSIDTIVSDETTPTADLAFSEVNFAHQVAEYCHNLSTNNNECIATVSVVPPKNYSKKYVTLWIGKKPVTDAAGNIKVSGTGLLGNKFMVGSTGRKAGFFHTTDGTAGGTVEINSYTNKVDDIGRYLQIVAFPLIHKGSFSLTSSGYIAASATDYAGKVNSLDANTSPEMKLLSSYVKLPFTLHLNALNDLAGAKYIVYTNDDNGNVQIFNSPTAALSTSDWTDLLTVRCIAAAIEVFRSIAAPFYGNLFSGVERNALEEQGNASIKDLTDLNYLRGGLLKVRATKAQEIKGEATARLELVEPVALKRIILYVALTKPTGDNN